NSPVITPDLTNDHDRRGRLVKSSYGTNELRRSYTAGGLLLAEEHTTGALSGLKIVHSYDALLRRQSTSVQDGETLLGDQLGFTWDTASRLSTVTGGGCTATYTYLASSPLWGSLKFQSGGTT